MDEQTRALVTIASVLEKHILDEVDAIGAKLDVIVTSLGDLKAAYEKHEERTQAHAERIKTVETKQETVAAGQRKAGYALASALLAFILAAVPVIIEVLN